MGNGLRKQLEKFICDRTCVSVLGLTAEKEDRLHCKGLAGELETLQVGQVLAMFYLMEVILSLKKLQTLCTCEKMMLFELRG